MPSTLQDERIQAQLARLRAEAALDGQRWQARRARQAREGDREGDSLVRMGEFYLGVSPEEGELLYLLARASKARRLVEFGASYGISTLYLGAAARDNGAHLFTTEVHPDKCRAVRDTLAQAGLDEVVTLLEGDALETLKTVAGPIDLVLLDGWKSLYLPVLELLRPNLGEGAVVAADNIDHPATADYLAALEKPDSGFATSYFGEMAVSCYLEGGGPSAAPAPDETRNQRNNR